MKIYVHRDGLAILHQMKPFVLRVDLMIVLCAPLLLLQPWLLAPAWLGEEGDDRETMSEDEEDEEVRDNLIDRVASP